PRAPRWSSRCAAARLVGRRRRRVCAAVDAARALRGLDLLDLVLALALHLVDLRPEATACLLSRVRCRDESDGHADDRAEHETHTQPHDPGCVVATPDLDLAEVFAEVP